MGVMISTVQSCSSPATMQILLKCFILALLVHNSLQLNQAAKCEEGCVEGFCNAMCAYTAADTICTCTQRVSNGNEGPIECVQPDGTACSGPLPSALDELGCKGACGDAGNPDCKAYSFKEISNQFFTMDSCKLLKQCSDEVDSPDPVLHINGARKCQNCPTWDYTEGQTTVHYYCDFDDNNPYTKPDGLPTGTVCTPAHMCKDPEVTETKNTIYCAEDGDGTDPTTPGKWKMQEDDSEVENNMPTDTECTCPTFQVAAQTGTRLACTTPVEPVDGLYTLDAENTCVLLCDGYYIMELSCRLGDEGSAWFAQWEDGSEQELAGCISCFEGGCPDSTTAGPTSPPSTTTTQTLF